MTSQQDAGNAYTVNYTYYTDNVTLFDRAIVTTECGGVRDEATKTSTVSITQIN